MYTCIGGRFVIQEQWKRSRAKRKLVSGYKHCGDPGGIAPQKKIWDCIRKILQFGAILAFLNTGNGVLTRSPSKWLRSVSISVFSCITNYRKTTFLPVRNKTNPCITAWGSRSNQTVTKGFHSSKKVEKHCSTLQRKNSVHSKAKKFPACKTIYRHTHTHMPPDYLPNWLLALTTQCKHHCTNFSNQVSRVVTFCQYDTVL